MKSMAEWAWMPCKRWFRFCLVAGLILASLVASAPGIPAQASGGDSPVVDSAQPVDAPTERLLIGVEGTASLAEIEQMLALQGLAVEQWWPDLQIVAARPLPLSGLENNQTALEARRRSLVAAPLFRYAELDGRVEAAVLDRSDQWVESAGSDAVSDPLLGQQWAVAQIGADRAWSIALGSSDVVVALIDSGFDVFHEDLDESSLWINQAELDGVPGVDDDRNGYVDDVHGWDWVDDDATANDPFGHGTHVGGTLVASTDNAIGVASIGRNLSIMPLRILDDRGSGFVSDLLSALDYARRHGARIVNLSLVLRFDSQALHDAIRAAHDSGMIVVAATGNFGSQVYWPAVYPETLAVAATDLNDNRSSFSNRGPEVDVAAPGSDVLSTFTNNSYFSNSGTSMATPHVSALAGLLWSLRPDLSRDAVVDLIRQSAADVNAGQYPGPDEYLGWGRIDAYQALWQASAGIAVNVVPAGASAGYVLAGQPLHYEVALSTTAGNPTTVAQGQDEMPVAGAVVLYELYGPAGDTAPLGDLPGLGQTQEITPAMAGSAISDNQGRVSVDFLAPEWEGEYRLRFRMGQIEREEPLYVVAESLSVNLHAVSPTLVVGDNTTELIAEVIGSNDTPIRDGLTVEWRTDLGSFGDGSQRRKGFTENGRVTEMFHAGNVAGIAHVTLRVGEQEYTIDVVIQPGPVYRLLTPDAPVVLVDWGEGGTVDLTLAIRDRLGNPAEDGVVVHFYATGAEITPSAPAVDGQVHAQLTIPPRAASPVLVWANTGDGFVQARLEVAILRQHYWLPLVGRE